MTYDRHIDAEIAREPRVFGPLHPGVVLREEFMEPLGISQNELARALGVSPRRVNEIVNEKRAITADTALRLSRCFGTSAEFWMSLQTDFELQSARDALSSRLEQEVTPLRAA
jgi:addiction module HigA family antidote